MAELSTIQIVWDDDDRPVITVKYGDSDGAPSEIQPDEWLAALAERLTDKSAKYLRKLLELNEAREHVSLADLASELGVAKKEADGWNRNLGRSIKAIVREYGFLRREQEDGTAQLFDFQWDDSNNQWLYAVPGKYRSSLAGALDER